MNNIIVNGKQVVIFDTENDSYDSELKDLVECFMKVKTSLFRNDVIKKGLITEEIEDIDYTVLSETISKFLGNNVSCFILKKGDFQIDEESFLIHPDKLKVTSGLNNCHDMNSFTEKYNEYTNFKQKFYEALEHFMMNPKYKGNVDINDEDFDDDGLNIQISPANGDGDEWFKKYHEEFCDKFQVQLMKAINVCNGRVNYIYIKKIN